MSATDPGWELYRSFLAVVRERSLSGAARALSLTQPTIGRHVDALEQALGMPLFTRSPTGLIATEGALGLVPHAEAMASAAAALARAASGQAAEERGAVRITASEMIGGHVLPAILTDFRRTHPRIDVELLLSNRSQDLLRRDADIAVRMVKPTQGALMAKKLGTLHLSLHAHPDYLRLNGTPRTTEDLLSHTLIGFDSAPPMQRLPRLEVALSRELFSFRCDSDLAQYAALCAGFGIGVCQNALGKRDGLLRIMPGVLDFQLGVWVVMHRDLKSSRRMRLMFDHLVGGLSRYIQSEA